MPRRRERGEVGDGGAGDERRAALGGKSEQLKQPSERRGLQLCHGRSHAINGRVLVPRGGQPVCGHGDGERTADHESEEARPRHRDRRGRAHVVEERDHLARVAGAGGKVAVEAFKLGEGGGGRCDASRVEPLEVADGALGALFEQGSHGVGVWV